MGIWYNGGSIAVENGSASVVGTTTLFMTKVKDGDTLYIPGGELYEVISRADDNHFTIDRAYSGDTDADASYYILPTSPDWGEVSEVAHDLANFLANVATFFPTDGKPSDDEGGNGSFAVDPNSTPPKFYVKTDGAWDDGTSLGGPKGDTGKGYGGTSTDSKTLADTGSMTFTTQAGMAWQAGNRIRISSAAAASTKWMEGVISSYSSTTLIITIDKKGSGTGSASDWNFGPAGQPGEKGDTGATGSTGSTGATGGTGLGYGGTSTTSRAIAATGSMTWTIGTGKAYQLGDLVKIVVTTDTTLWMKGIVSDYSSGVLTVAINEKSGTGTYASWNIGLAGETGPQGEQGEQGETGETGADGTLVNSTSTTDLTPAIDDLVFTVDTGLSYIPGMRLRGASDANPTTNWFSGIVTDYTTTSLTINVDTLGPSILEADDWSISLTGEVGPSSGGNVVGPASSVDQNLAAFDGATGLLLADAGVNVAAIIASAVAAATAPRNRVINPQMLVAQAGVGSTTDGNYTGIDQWYALTQTGAVTSSQLTNVADGVPSMGRLTQSQSTAQRFGWAQVFESSFVKDLRSKTVTLAAKARMSAATKLRYAIVEWTGTADSVTKDVVASWSNTTFDAGQFFSGTNLTIAATGSIDLSASTLTDITLSAGISSSMNNIIIIFWTDSTQAQTVTLDIGNVFFGQGASAPAVFDPPAPDNDFIACLRYFYKYQAPSSPNRVAYGFNLSATVAVMTWRLNPVMRAAPTLAYSSLSDWSVYDSTQHSLTALSLSAAAPDLIEINPLSTGMTTGAPSGLRSGSSSAWFTLDARL